MENKCTLEDVQSNGEIYCRVICPIHSSQFKCCKFCDISETCLKVCGWMKSNKNKITIKCLKDECGNFFCLGTGQGFCNECNLFVLSDICILPEKIKQLQDELDNKRKLLIKIKKINNT